MGTNGLIISQFINRNQFFNSELHLQPPVFKAITLSTDAFCHKRRIL